MIRHRGTSALAHRNYRLFFAGQAVSLIGTWMQQVAQAWLVLQLTSDPVWLGVVAAAQFVPVMIFGLFAGIVADTLPKRQTLIVVEIVMMALAAILAVLTVTGLATVPIIVGLALLLGVANAVDMPVRQAFSIEMVGREDITNAVSLNSAMFNGARIVGPAIAGITIGLVGVGAAFAINAASFLAVIVGLVAMRDEELHHPPRIARPRTVRAVGEHLGAGLSYVRQTPLVLLAVLVVGLAATVALNFTVVIPVLARDHLGSDASGFGFLMAASGIGSLSAAIWLAFRSRATPVFIPLGAILLGVGSIVLGISQVFAVSLVVMAAIGFGTIMMASTANNVIQLAVPDSLRGRVMGVYTTIFAGSTPIGGPLMGGLASAFGIAVAVSMGGLLALAIGLWALVWMRRENLERAIERDPGSGAPATAATANTAPAASATATSGTAPAP